MFMIYTVSVICMYNVFSIMCTFRRAEVHTNTEGKEKSLERQLQSALMMTQVPTSKNCPELGLALQI